MILVGHRMESLCSAGGVRTYFMIKVYFISFVMEIVSRPLWSPPPLSFHVLHIQQVLFVYFSALCATTTCLSCNVIEELVFHISQREVSYLCNVLVLVHLTPNVICWAPQDYGHLPRGSPATVCVPLLSLAVNWWRLPWLWLGGIHSVNTQKAKSFFEDALMGIVKWGDLQSLPCLPSNTRMWGSLGRGSPVRWKGNGPCSGFCSSESCSYFPQCCHWKGRRLLLSSSWEFPFVMWSTL